MLFAVPKRDFHLLEAFLQSKLCWRKLFNANLRVKLKYSSSTQKMLFPRCSILLKGAIVSGPGINLLKIKYCFD